MEQKSLEKLFSEAEGVYVTFVVVSFFKYLSLSSRWVLVFTNTVQHK